MARNEPKIYHHSNIKGIIIKTILIIIAAAFILSLTAFFGFRKFIAYTDTGKLYLDIPWLYGYMDGPPAEDDLAPYLAPVETAKPNENVQEEPIAEENTPTEEDAVSDEGQTPSEEPETSAEEEILPLESTD